MDNYTDKYLKYKNKYLELKQKTNQNDYNQTGGLADPKYDEEYAKLLAANPHIDHKLLSAQHELLYNADHSYTSPGVEFDAPKKASTPKTSSTTKTINNTYLYSPYLDPLVAYTLPGHKYYTKTYLDPYYTTNVYSPYTYYKSSYRDPYADDYYYDDEEKPKRRSKRKTSKKKSKKTSKRKTSKRKSKKKSKRRSRK
jgi:hypothetical protein